jgi:DNA-binding transcriptional LysR family regulator
MALTLRQLEVLRAVARCGAVTQAAAELGVSQPAVSMLLRDCAAGTGFPLFIRRRGRLQATPELRAVLDDIERVFTGLDRINRLVEDMRGSNIGSVAIAATPTLADNLLPHAVATLRRRRPRIHVVVQTMDNIAAVEAVVQGEVDFGLVLTPIAEPDARLVPLCRGELVCVVRCGHPLAEKAMVEPHDLAPYPLISFSRSLPLGALVEESFRAAGIPRRIALEVTQSSVALALSRAGAGVAVIDPFLLVGAHHHGVVALPFCPPARVEAQALLPSEGTLSRPALMLLATLRRSARVLTMSTTTATRGIAP